MKALPCSNHVSKNYRVEYERTPFYMPTLGWRDFVDEARQRVRENLLQ